MSIFDYIYFPKKYEEISALIESIVNVNLTDNCGRTPLFAACVVGNFEICKLLISRGANVNQAKTDSGETPLWIASRIGHLEICQLLISSGANVNQARTDNGETPLLVASCYRRLEIFRLLISSGANVNQDYRYHGDIEILQTADHEINRRQENSIILLLERSFNPDSLFYEDNLPLDLFKFIWNESYLSLE